jgi:flagellar motor switch protein FliN/FliY
MADQDETEAAAPAPERPQERPAAPRPATGRKDALAAIYDTEVEVSVVLGTSTIRVRDLLKLGRGAIVELDRKIDDLSDIIVSGRMVARGEVTIVEDKLAVTFREFARVNT